MERTVAIQFQYILKFKEKNWRKKKLSWFSVWKSSYIDLVDLKRKSYLQQFLVEFWVWISAGRVVKRTLILYGKF